MKQKVNIKVIKGVEGNALLVNDWRVAGSKPWGGGQVIHEFDVSMTDVFEALGCDVTEVVRCRNCRYRLNDTDFSEGHFCTKRRSNGGKFCRDNDFCSYGKRKENE